MNKVYKALADPTRRKILELLRKKDRTAGEIAQYFNITKPSLSKHFAVLKDANLIQGMRNGTTITYCMNVSVLEEALMTFMNGLKIKGANYVKRSEK